MTLSVVVLAYNEEVNLAPSVDEILAELGRLDVSWELLLVDDGSTDGTGALIDAYARRPGVRAIHHPRNLGLGGGYRTGFAEARGDYLTFFPADGQFPPAIIGQFLPRMADHDLVLGYLPERRGNLIGRGLSLAERAAYRALLGPMPRFQGIFMIRRALLADIPLRSQGRGWAVVMELILRTHRARHRVVSVPTRVRPRLSGASKVNNLRTIVANARQLLALRRLLD